MICDSGSSLFYPPSTGYVKTLLQFLIQHNSTAKSNNKVPVSFYAVSDISSLVMISSLVQVIFARKKTQIFSSKRYSLILLISI